MIFILIGLRALNYIQYTNNQMSGKPVKKATVKVASKVVKPAAKTASKPAPKPTKKDVIVSDSSSNNSDSSDNESINATNIPIKPTSKTNKGKVEPSIEDIYKKKDPRQHVLDLPDTYIGSVEQDTNSMHVYDQSEKMICKKDISYVPGFYKTCDELFVNARDETVRSENCTKIKINIDKENGIISVWNNGDGIPVVMHKEHKVYVPELIFGHLLTSSNYDQKGKTTGGKNGYGSKLCSIFSTKFVVETVDKEKKKYTQEFLNNMSEIGKPIIKDMPKSTESYVLVTYHPDFKRFGMKGLSTDVVNLLKKRVYDIAACTQKTVKVYLNDELIKQNSFEDFIKLHYKVAPELIYADVNPRWKVGVVFDADSGGGQVSFANGIWTYQGGTHVDYIFNQITKKVVEHVSKKNKSLHVKPSQIKEHLTLFVSAVIDDPSFSSQTKGELTTKVANFGTTCELDSAFIGKILKTKLIDIIVKYAELKEMSSLKTTDGKKVVSLRDIQKLEDAHWAGGRKSHETRLILTEGDSAKSYAIAGLGIIGRQRYGVFPLKGKVLNVRNATAAQIKKNTEFLNLKKILGLKQNMTYTNTKKLRYGGILILTDQDPDGSHIKGLLINMFQYFWPELLKIPGFIQTMSTPLIKVFKKTDTKKKNPETFYSVTEFEKWEKQVDISKYQMPPKYYKGLGTSSDMEAMEVFKDFDKRVVSYGWEKLASMEVLTEKSNKLSKLIEMSDESNSSDEESEESSENDNDDNSKVDANENDPIIYKSKSYDAITLAFDQARANDRKKWLTKYNRDNILEYTTQDVKYSDFVHKDLIHFSIYDNVRSIPSLIDGLKPSQRKILFAAFKKNLKNEIKVIQFANYVSEQTAYKHGEKSLEGAIVGMGQRFVGSNNLYLLHPSGNFGHRKQGGDEHADGRYIFTYIEPIAHKIFRSEDESILKYIIDEGASVEPEYYHPIIPMVLVNGGHGVGTGFSTSVPQYNPLDICNNLLAKLDNRQMSEMDPWWYGYTGKVTRVEEGQYKITGSYKLVGNDVIKVTELPIRGLYCWTDKYIEYLNSLIKDGSKIADVISYCGNNSVDIDIVFAPGELQKLIKKGGDDIEKLLKLSTNMKVSNLYLYNDKHEITHYETPLDIMEEFYENRFNMYCERKKNYLKILKNQMEFLKYKAKFIGEVVDETIIIAKKSKDEIISKLVKKEYPKLHTDHNASEENKSYTYLTSMQLFSLTSEKIEELNKEYQAKKSEYEIYNSTSEADLWTRELEEFKESYKQWLKLRKEEEDEEERMHKLGKEKFASKKPKKIKKK